MALLLLFPAQTLRHLDLATAFLSLYGCVIVLYRAGQPWLAWKLQKSTCLCLLSWFFIPSCGHLFYFLPQKDITRNVAFVGKPLYIEG